MYEIHDPDYQEILCVKDKNEKISRRSYVLHVFRLMINMSHDTYIPQTQKRILVKYAIAHATQANPFAAMRRSDIMNFMSYSFEKKFISLYRADMIKLFVSSYTPEHAKAHFRTICSTLTLSQLCWHSFLPRLFARATLASSIRYYSAKGVLPQSILKISRSSSKIKTSKNWKETITILMDFNFRYGPLDTFHDMIFYELFSHHTLAQRLVSALPAPPFLHTSITHDERNDLLTFHGLEV